MKDTKKKTPQIHYKYFQSNSSFFPTVQGKKTFALRAEGRWTDPKSQKFSQPESKHEDPPQKKLIKTSFNWLLPITAIGPPPASVMYVFQLDRKNWDPHHRIETPTTPHHSPPITSVGLKLGAGCIHRCQIFVKSRKWSSLDIPQLFADKALPSFFSGHACEGCCCQSAFF